MVEPCFRGCYSMAVETKMSQNKGCKENFVQRTYCPSSRSIHGERSSLGGNPWGW